MKMIYRVLAAGILFLVAWLPAMAAQAPIQLSSDRFVQQDTVAPAQAQLLAQLNMLTGAGGKFKVSVAASYVGALDVSGAGTNVIGCYSLQACSSALRGSAALNACDSTGGVDVACADLLTDATTGLLVAATIGGGTCPGTLGANCTIKTWYAYTATALATTQCGGSDCHLKTGAGGIASRPTLIASGFGSGPAAVMTQFQGLDTFTTSLTQAQPFTLAAVACQVADRGGLDLFFGNAAANGAIYWNGTPSLALFAGGGSIATASTRNTWERYFGMFSGGSSVGQVNATSAPVSPGTGGFSAQNIALNVLGFAAIFRGAEFIIWSADKSASFGNLNSNQSTRFGSGSC